MASVPNTYALGCFIEKGKLADAGVGNLVLVLFKSIGSATDTILRNCQTLPAMFTAGAVRCDFSSYADKILGAADVTISYVTGSSPYKAILTPATQVWNPAGGAVNNSPVKSALLYRANVSDPESAWFPLGTCDASGTAGGGSYTHTFAPMTDQAT